MTERVYFAYAFLEGGWKVKVGYTQNLANRIKELRRSYGTDVVLLADVVGDTFDEAALHMILKNYLFRNEWFFPSKRVHALVAHIKQTEEIPESVRHLGRAIREERRAKRERVSIERVTNAYAAASYKSAMIGLTAITKK